ncbi:M24 family metallopeptidase [Corynebacterium caspium]|uniref:M24 family metallopeptidase n=1 Tax=Corynebacterium caspium TaxID=234828 RepID=UPI0003690AFB|nr:Xaa-Pro peptidase family protein [Corynebacterium caspium]WKD59206.1 putative peptidase [Corynebacterium caspium DSM 44850]
MALADQRFSKRRRAIAAQLASKRIDALLVTSSVGLRYFSGFTGSNGALLIPKDLRAKIATDGRYTTQIAAEVPDIAAIIARPPAEALLETLNGYVRVGFEANTVTYEQLQQFARAAGDEVALIPVSGEIEQLRAIKDPVELQSLREVAALATEAFEELIAAGGIAPGRTELEVAADLEYRMRSKGAQRPSFDTIVASGPNGAMPHHSAGKRILATGDLVTIDFGAYLDGYNSDMTRTVGLGKISSELEELYDLVYQAQIAGVAAALPGTSLAEVDKTCRDIIEEAGFGQYFNHSTGHGIGLEVHEYPWAATSGTGELVENQTLTIEPGIYIPGKGGVRIEDTLIITAGKPETITTAPKELRLL